LRIARRVLAVACCLVAANAAPAQAADADGQDAASLELGQRIYREGIGASGEPLSGIGSARARLSGKNVACVACHRRSGYGTSEGRFFIRPITGPALREDLSVAVRSPRIKSRLGSRPRPAYTEATLARAIRKGVDSAGKPLDPAMPRYAMSDAEMKAIAAYLFSLSERPSPGVDAQDIHFATVIQPGVAPERRRAMLEIMQAFVKDKDSNMRLEDRRRQVGNFRRYRAYRKWVLHVWELKGPSESWSEQLEAYYRQQPVFALIGGLGGSSWQPVHEFSERFEIPCIFPQVDLPTVSGVNNYTVYLSKGVVLEAEVLAKFLRDKGAAKSVVQAYRPTDAGAAAAAALRSALGADIALEDRVLEGSADGAFWQSVFGARADALVLWLGARDLEGVPEQKGSTRAVYLSFDLLDGKRPDAAARLGEDVRLIYPSDLPPRHKSRLLRNTIWLHNKSIGVTDEAVQMNTLFAMAVVSDAVGHMSDSFSRDYFVERVEHVVTQTPVPSIYPKVSLGPGQRFAAKGSSIVRWGNAEPAQLRPLSEWIVP